MIFPQHFYVSRSKN